MKEDLSLYGNELNYFTTFFKWVAVQENTSYRSDQWILTPGHIIGYMVMLYPSCILISHIGPSKWLPSCEVRLTGLDPP